MTLIHCYASSLFFTLLYRLHALRVCITQLYYNICNFLCLDFHPAGIGGDGLFRYGTNFHEIEKIGYGNFNQFFKVLKRLDGCMYAVKHSMRQDVERQFNLIYLCKALMEVQALAALVGYYFSWFENKQLYIQLELCEHNLSLDRIPKLFTEREALEAMYQRSSHLDVKPENIYVRNGVYRLGDFGCATAVDKSWLIEEGDARYMPQEILNENYENLDKVDIFSSGASIYELARGSPLPESGSHFLTFREGKLPLLPCRSIPFQNLIKLNYLLLL
ncbi:hypothetical protein MIMGU_mgv1a021232mg [Erythranthe guttata]|uniref:Protein kinase domain-containing protein n=1 Tax=Erythranthe guttata TaxID=4155 RepID=A0A022RA34_ERYGU|nr:hypothetical protein MIMGU_mgv1a021232mg [Erythranthe guttata]